MKKLFKRALALVVAAAMVFTGFAFNTGTANAETWTKLVLDQWTKAGAWDLQVNSACTWAEMSYASTGNNLGDTKVKLDNSPNGDWNDVEYSMIGQLKNFAKNKMEDGYAYRAAITINTTKAGKLLANIMGKEYKINVAEGQSTVYTDYFYYREPVVTADPTKNDVTFYFAQFPTDSVITISNVQFDKENEGWTAVPNFNPDGGGEATYTKAGRLDLMAMYGIQSAMYGALQYKVAEDPKTIADTTVKVTSTSGWLDSWSTNVRLTNYVGEKGLEPLVQGEKYTGKLVFTSTKDSEEDEHGNPKTLRMVLNGKLYDDIVIKKGTNTYNIPEFEYTGAKTDVEFELDGFAAGSEFCIKELSFEGADKDWTRCENGEETPVGAWRLFGLNMGSIEAGQWGALSYKNNVATPTKLEDTFIKVRSSSGWHGAWATMATAKNYATTLEEGKTYDMEVTYFSSKATATSSTGDKNTVLMVLDKDQQFEFPLEKCNGTEYGNLEYKTAKFTTTNRFTFEKAGDPEKEYDIIFNLDQVEKDTNLIIKEVKFTEVQDGWTPTKNNKYTKCGEDGLWEAYARFNSEDGGSWGKISYKTEEGYKSDISKTSFKVRSNSGWFMPNPATLISLPNYGDGTLVEDLHYTCTVKLNVQLNPDATVPSKARLIVDGIIEQDKSGATGTNEFALKNGEVTFTSDKFKFSNTSKDVQIDLDQVQPGTIVTVKEVSFTLDKEDEGWTKVENKVPATVGPWTLFASFGENDNWGKILYKTTGDNLGDTTIKFPSTSGWYDARATLATLNRYAQGKMFAGEDYSATIKLDSSISLTGKDDDGNTKGIRVTIDNADYIIQPVKGSHTYVIPNLTYTAASSNVTFNFDEMDADSYVTISEVTFGNPITEVPEINDLDVQVNKTSAKITWEQTPNTIYYTGSFKVYIDGQLVDTLTGLAREYTATGLAVGNHTVKVTGVMGGAESAGASKQITIEPEVTTKAPTPTTAAPQPTSKVNPTTKVTPTTKVVKPGKAKIKKIAKRKKSAKKMKVTLKKVANAKGYQIAVYKTKKNAKKNKKALVKKYTTKTKYTIKSKKFKKKKTLYVKARAYNLNGTTKVFGAWSAIKKSKAK